MERTVLLRIQHFQQRRSGVTLVIRADLVDFIEHKHRIRCPAFLDSIDDPAG